MESTIFSNATKSISNFYIKNNKLPPQHKDLIEFEEDLPKSTSNVQSKRATNGFEERLKNDLRPIQSSEKLFLFADKTRNTHKMEKSHYEKHLRDNITKIYKQSNNNLIMLVADKEDFNINPIVA